MPREDFLFSVKGWRLRRPPKGNPQTEPNSGSHEGMTPETDDLVLDVQANVGDAGGGGVIPSSNHACLTSSFSRAVKRRRLPKNPAG